MATRSATKRPYILGIDLGTYCDNKLMEAALSPLAERGAEIVYFTDRKHDVPKAFTVETYETPKYMVTDTDLALVDSSKNLWWAALTNPISSFKAYSFNSDLRARLEATVRARKPRAIVVAYPALVVVANMDPKVLEKTKVYVLYYSPGFPNRSIPWLFDTVVKRDDFSLYHNAPADNVRSGTEFLKRAMIRGKMDVLKTFHHVFCWDEALTEKIVPSLGWSKVHRVGALLPGRVERLARWGGMTQELRDVLRGKKEIFFVSFGSYGETGILEGAVDVVLEGLRRYCGEHKDAVVLYHNGKRRRASWLYCVKGFIPYEYIVPRCKLVIFTGSLCMQIACMYHRCPMTFVPLLAEQFFWARNYQHFTGVEFVHHDRPVFDAGCIEHACRPHPWVNEVSRSLTRSKCARELVRLIL
jgi:hypothetical protein